MRNGRWVAWLLLDRCEPGAQQADQLPTWPALRWLTRGVHQAEVDHFRSEPDQVGVVPAVVTSLYQITIRRWWGAPLILWRTEVMVQVWTHGVVTLWLDRAYADEQAARRDFTAHQAGLRRALAGESHPWYELARSEQTGS